MYGRYKYVYYLEEEKSRLVEALEWWNASSCGVLIPSIFED